MIILITFILWGLYHSEKECDEFLDDLYKKKNVKFRNFIGGAILLELLSEFVRLIGTIFKLWFKLLKKNK